MTPQGKNPTGNPPMSMGEYDRRMERIGAYPFFGILAGAVLGVGNLIYQFNRSQPPAPEGYSTFVAAQTTLSSLVNQKGSLKEATLILNLPTPYRTEAINKALEGYSNTDREDLNKLETAISIVEDDIAKMKDRHPEFVDYLGRAASFNVNQRGYALLGSPSLFVGCMLASAKLQSLRKERLKRKYANQGAQK